jgi:PTH1 family peptidyl-tRNA hydrolase
VTRLVVGLGNPGPEYEWTPHNLGFHALEKLAQASKLIFVAAGTPAASSLATTAPGFRWPAAPCRVARDERRDAWLVQPLAFVNRSGAVVAPLVRALGVRPEDLMVVYDDIDLPPGSLRIRPRGGHGGHNGVRSIVDELGFDSFPRLRMGVGRPRTDAARHVLSQLRGDERVAAEIAVAEAASALDAWLAAEDLERVMTRFHSRWNEMGLAGPH